MSLLTLAAGLVLFLGTHLVTTARDGRARIIAAVGEAPYKIGYAVLSFLGLALIGNGFGAYREQGYIQVWNPPAALMHLNLVLMLPIFVMLYAAYLPGAIKRTLKHPMLTAVKLWAVGHLLANGDLGSMLLFGAFLAWAVYDRISMKRRPVPEHGVNAVVAGSRANDLIAIALGLATYLAFVFYLHKALIGVSVLPGGG